MQMNISVYDRNNGYDLRRLNKHQLIGVASFTSSRLISAAGQQLTLPIRLGSDDR
jgi:hypothetical protein